MKKLFKFLTSRVFVFGLGMFIQVALLVLVIIFFGKYDYYAYLLFTILSLCTIIQIIASDENPIYKLAWILPIAAVPLLGWAIYLIAGKNRISKKNRKKAEAIYNSTVKNAVQDQKVIEKIEDDEFLKQVHYIKNTALLPVHTNTQTEYLSPGETFFDKLCEELEKAEKFILMEYFIVQEGKMWDKILDILHRKAKAGVEVKMMYDDLGCIGTLPSKYYKKLEAMGIEVAVVNVFKPSVDTMLNYRDHRKITVIDGNVGFTGGNNLADEYINAYPKHGHWKDSQIMLKGDAVWNLTLIFFQIWQFYHEGKIELENYRPTEHYDASGFVLPFCDGPLDNHLIGESQYISMITNAKKYCSITTPYLILDNEVVSALRATALSGVKVSIITPGIADKWYVHLLTRHNYRTLVEAGVEIYEYEPGFIHAKTMVCDDEIAIVGTQNFDFRSFYMHFECSALLYKTTSIKDIRKDHLETIAKSKLITLENCRNPHWYVRLLQVILKPFSPLM